MSERSSSVSSSVSSDDTPLVFRMSPPSPHEVVDAMFRAQTVEGPFVIVGQSIYLRALVNQIVLHRQPFATESSCWYNAACSMLDLPSPYPDDTPVLLADSGRVVSLSAVPVPDHITVAGQRYGCIDLFAKSIEISADDPCAWQNLGRLLRHPCDVPVVPEGDKASSQAQVTKYAVTISGEEINALTAYQRSLALNPTNSRVVKNACEFFEEVNIAKTKLLEEGDAMPESRRAAIAAAVAKEYAIEIEGVTYKTEESLRTLVLRMVPDDSINVADLCRLRGCAVLEGFPEEFLPMPEPGDDYEAEVSGRQELWRIARAFASLIAADYNDASLWYALGKFVIEMPVTPARAPVPVRGTEGKTPQWQHVTAMECFQNAVAADPTMSGAYIAIACELNNAGNSTAESDAESDTGSDAGSDATSDAENAESSVEESDAAQSEQSEETPQLRTVSLLLPKSHVDGDTATRRVFDRNEEKQSVEFTAVQCAARAAELAPRDASAWSTLTAALVAVADDQEGTSEPLVAFVGQEALPLKVCAARAVENEIDSGAAWAELARALLRELQAAPPVEEVSAAGKRPRDGDSLCGKPQLPYRRPASFAEGSECAVGQIDLTWFHSRRTSPEINKKSIHGIPVAPLDGSEPRYHRLAVAEVALRAIELDDRDPTPWIVVGELLDFLQEHPERFPEVHLVTDAFRTQGLTEDMMPQWVFHLAEQTLTRSDVMMRLCSVVGGELVHREEGEEESDEGEEESDEDA